MISHWSEAAVQPLVQAVVAVASVVNLLVAGVLTVIGAQINDGLLSAGLLLIASTGVALISWCLLAVVRLSTVVSRLEANQAENQRRLNRLEGE